MNNDRVMLQGSRPPATAGLQNCGDPPPSDRLTVTVMVRRWRPEESRAQYEAIVRGERPPLTREEAAQTMGADPADIEKVKDFAGAHGLVVESSNQAERSVKLSGSVAQMEAAFGANLLCGKLGDQTFVYHTEPLSVPASLAGVVEAVLGLDQRPAARVR